jgi:prophage tail gpP-like protein
VGISDFLGALGAAAARSPVPRDGTRRHRVAVTIGAEQIDGWIDYEIQSSMVEPTDGFRLSRPFDKRAWDLCQLDQKVKVSIDGVVMLDGFIDDRARSTSARTLEIAGRDKAGRLVQESIPTVSGFDGLNLVEAVKRLATPWFTSITLTDGRNRSVRRGKGHRAAAGGEPAFFKVSGKLDEEHAGRVDPGQRRWDVIEQLCSSIGVMAWSSADGRELVIGEPNYQQAIQYLFRHASSGSTVKEMALRESVQDAFALIEVHGSGAGDEDNFGDDVTTYVGTAKDGPNADGTGKNFLHPKRLVVAQSALTSNAEARRSATREMKRRAFKMRQLTVEAPLHGQVLAGVVPTLFAPNTLARVVDEELELDETWLIYAVAFNGSRRGETSQLMLVPRGTQFVS